jgi:ribonuclease HII
MTSTRVTAARRRRSRTSALFRFDRSLGVRVVAGADEAGRGCLAGPLVAAAVALDLEVIGRQARRDLEGLDDSKRITPARREELAAAILLHARQVVVVSACAPSLDRNGLHRSNLRLLAQCLAAIDPGADACIVDGFRLPDPAPKHRAVIDGDATSAAVAAASVIAKTTRDRLMAGPAHASWPVFGFERHVGYATPEHQAALRATGLCPLHRRSFRSGAYPELRLFDVGPPAPAGVSNAPAT